MIEIRVSKSHHRKILITAILAVAALVGAVKWYTASAFATGVAMSAGERVVTIHDGDVQKGLVTSATTLRQVLQQAHIPLNQGDITEPGLDEPLVASSYDANIYRARPVVVQDGAHSIRIMTAYRTVTQIAKQAGVPLNDADTAELKPAVDIASVGAAEVMVINRATPITFEFYGKTIQTSTRATTVGALLKERKITPQQDDTVVPAANAPITPGMTVQLWRNGKQTITVDEPIPFTTRQIQDANQNVGYKQIQTPGVNGEQTVTYDVEMRNGQEVSRTQTNAIVTKDAVEQVEVIGTKVALPAGSHEDWMAAAGISAGDFGYVNYIVTHEGGWEPCKVQGGAINCSYSGSMGYGLVQATPGIKMASAGSDWRTNPITQLKWANSYAVSRYGSWQGAYSHWVSQIAIVGHGNW